MFLQFDDKKILKIAFLSLFISIFLGVLLRWAYSSVFSEVLSYVDIRRAHSHMGIYLFLFPVFWLFLNKHKYWTPSKPLFFLYLLISFLAILSFLFYSYQIPSKVFSFFVLIFWFIFALKNTRQLKSKPNWLSFFIPAIFLSVLSIAILVSVAISKPLSHL